MTKHGKIGYNRLNSREEALEESPTMKFLPVFALACLSVSFSAEAAYNYYLLPSTAPKIDTSLIGNGTSGITNRSVIVNTGAGGVITLDQPSKWAPNCGFNDCTPYILQLGNHYYQGAAGVPSGPIEVVYTGSPTQGTLHFYNDGALYIDGATLNVRNDSATALLSVVDIDNSGDFQLHAGTVNIQNGASGNGAALSVLGNGLLAIGTSITGTRSVTVNVASKSYITHQGTGYFEIGGGGSNPTLNIQGTVGVMPGVMIHSGSTTPGAAEFDIKGGTFNLTGNGGVTHAGEGGFVINGGTFNMSGTSYVGRGVYDTAGNPLIGLPIDQDLVMLEGAYFYLSGNSGIINGSNGGIIYNGWVSGNSYTDGAAIIAYGNNEITASYLDLGGMIAARDTTSVLNHYAYSGEEIIWAELSGWGTHKFASNAAGTQGSLVDFIGGSLISSGWTWNAAAKDMVDFNINNHVRLENAAGGNILFYEDSTLLVGIDSTATTVTTASGTYNVGTSSYLSIGGAGTVTIDSGAFLSLSGTFDPTLDIVIVKNDAGTLFTNGEWQKDYETYQTNLLYTVLWNQLDDPELITIRILGIDIDNLDKFEDENIVELVRGFKEGISNPVIYQIIDDLAALPANKLEKALYELTAEGYDGIFNTVLITQQNINNMMMHSALDMRNNMMRYKNELRPDYYEAAKKSPCGVPLCKDVQQYQSRYSFRDMSVWAKAYYSTMSQDERPGKPGRRWGYDFDSYALMAGIDRAYDDIIVGVAGVIGQGDYEQQEMITFTGDTTFYGLLPYISIIDGDWVNDFTASFIRHSAETKRYISLYNTTATADYNIDVIGATWISNYVYRDGPMTWIPHFGLEYTHVMQEEFKEKNANIAGYRIHKNNYDSLRSVLGLRWMYEWKKRLLPELKAQWKYDFLHERTVQEVNFLANPASTFKAWGAEGGANALIFGAALNFRWMKNANIRGSYDLELKKEYTNHQFGIGIDFYF